VINFIIIKNLYFNLYELIKSEKLDFIIIYNIYLKLPAFFNFISVLIHLNEVNLYDLLELKMSYSKFINHISFQ